MTPSPQKTSVRPADIAHRRPRFRSNRTRHFTESVIREMTRLALEVKAVNLAQGFPDFSAPEQIKRAAQEAIAQDFNQYAITWGAKPFRDAIAAKYRKWYGLDYDPEREITVCCGSTEGMIASLLAVTNPGDEVIVFEPYYENYGPDTLLCDAERKLVALRPPDWTFDPDGSAPPSPPAPKPSSSTRLTIQPEKFLRGKNCNSSPTFARNSTPLQLLTKFMNTFCMNRHLTSR